MREIGTDTRAIGVTIVGADVERIFQVVQIAKLDSAVHAVIASWSQQDVLDLRASESLQANRKLPACDRFTDDREKRPMPRSKQQVAVELDHDTQDVRARKEVGAWLLEYETTALEYLA